MMNRKIWSMNVIGFMYLMALNEDNNEELEMCIFQNRPIIC